MADRDSASDEDDDELVLVAPGMRLLRCETLHQLTPAPGLTYTRAPTVEISPPRSPNPEKSPPPPPAEAGAETTTPTEDNINGSPSNPIPISPSPSKPVAAPGPVDNDVISMIEDHRVREDGDLEFLVHWGDEVEAVWEEELTVRLLGLELLEEYLEKNGIENGLG